MIQPVAQDLNWTSLADAACRLAAQDAIDIARRFGTPVILGEGGKVLRLTPDEAQARLDAANANRSGSASS